MRFPSLLPTTCARACRTRPFATGCARTARREDDRVIVDGSLQTRLSEIVEQRGTRIAFPVDLLEIVFVEK
jgi:hypothetical protein